ncbi:Uncharacterised protein [Mycobacteroides abscessus subsp. abscessus]|nr:Uncharacterised protein [Mycobacteroides abscessus subsp. abscessus]
MNPAPRGEVELVDVVGSGDIEVVARDRGDSGEDADDARHEQKCSGHDGDSECGALFRLVLLELTTHVPVPFALSILMNWSRWSRGDCSGSDTSDHRGRCVLFVW